MRAERMPHEPALCSDTIRWTRAQLLDAVVGLAAAMADAGLAAGDRLGTLLEDDAPAVVLIHAARRTGLTLVPLNRRAAVPELERQLAQAGVRALIFDEAHAAVAAKLTNRDLAAHRIEVMLAGAACQPRWALGDHVDLDAAAAIVFTSGTSGRPKGAVLTHGNLAASAHDWAGCLRPRAGDRWLACLPLSHVAGLAIVTRSGRWGTDLEVQRGFDASAVSAAIDAGASHLSLVPTQLHDVLEERSGAAVPPSLRAILLGGAPIPGALLARARAAGYPVLTTYGMTETSSGIAVGGADPATLAAAGAARPLNRVEVRIEPDGAPDGGGQIVVRGPMVFGGYLDDAAATDAVLRDGWFRTGDIGRLDEQGLLHVLDRRDDLIVSGGENVYPAEVEAVLKEHAAVADAAVYGWPHERWGAVPVAAVVPGPGATFDEAALRQHCRDRLAAFKVPADIQAVPALPRDELGKLRRRELAAGAAAETR